MIRIVLIDSNRLFRVSLKSLIDSFADCEVIKNVSTLREIPKDFEYASVHLVIFDPKKPQNPHLDLIRKMFPSSKMILLTALTDQDAIKAYIDSGISGFFSKDDCPTQLQSALAKISENYNANEIMLGSVVRQFLLKDVNVSQRKKVKYTAREIQVLKLVCLEKTNAEISEILGLSIRTVESHRRRMIDKTDCKSIIGVILNALELKSVNLKLPVNNTNQAS